MRDGYSNFGWYNALESVCKDAANGSLLTGVTIDTRGFETVMFVVNTGLVESMTASTTSWFVLQIQHTDASALGAGPSDFAAVLYGSWLIHSVISGTQTLTSGIWQNSINGDSYGSTVFYCGYKGPCRYVRIMLSGTLDSAASINIGAVAILGLPANWPVCSPSA